MAGDFDFSPDVTHNARSVNEERRAFDTHVGLAVHRLFNPDSIILANMAVGVRRQNDAQIMLGDELVMLGGGVFGHPDHDCILGLERVERFGKPDRFFRAAGSVVAWIEIQDDILWLQGLQSDLFAAVAGILTLVILVSDALISRR